MNYENVTLNEKKDRKMNKDLLVKLIEILVSNDVDTNTKESHIEQSLKGKPVIVRCGGAGVHFGYYVSHSGREVVLSKSRRMHRWWAKKQMTLSAVSEFGLNLDKKDRLRIQCEMSSNVHLLDACEILPCTKECVESFAKVEPYDEQ